MSKWTRRSLIIGAAAFGTPVAALAVGKLWCQLGTAQRAQLSNFYPLMMMMYTDPDAAAAIGELYLQQSASTALNALARLQATAALRHAISTRCGIETMRVAQQACREDFCVGRINCIGGWVLAQTELDVAALFTML